MHIYECACANSCINTHKLQRQNYRKRDICLRNAMLSCHQKKSNNTIQFTSRINYKIVQ